MRIPNDNPVEFLTRIVPFVDSDGARNLNAICHKLSIPYQTLRFRMNKLKEQGISVIPIIDSDKLGLQRVRATFELPTDVQNPKPLLGGLHQKAGLRSYSRYLLTQELDCNFLIPRGSIIELGKLLRGLEEMKLIENVNYRTVVWNDVFMMKTKYFDYESGEWDVDFSRLVGDPAVAIPILSPTNLRLDYNDLLIIKSLELDPWIKVVDIAEKVGLSVGDVSYHLNKHVFGKGLVSCFRLRWIGTQQAWSKHTIVGQTFVFENLSDELTRHAMSVMTSTPFSWNHVKTEDGTYMAELLIPVSHFPETQAHVSQKLRPLGLKPIAHYMDWSCSSSFTIPYTLFEKDHWELDAETALSYVLQMISQYQKT
ncbi:MAG: winged helix-turn-helix transcriptional regulator [Nitrososphaerales archaeon]|jgi:DNA-binding Lrp family transcriptional regulator